MRIIIISVVYFLIAMVAAPSVWAGFSVPNHVYSVSRLRIAEKHAKQVNKPISFVYSNKNTDCGLATAASKDVFRLLKNHTVMVYAGRGDWDKLPLIVKRGINSSEAGDYIPKTVVVSPELDEIIVIIPYARTEQRTQLIKQARQIIADY